MSQPVTQSGQVTVPGAASNNLVPPSPIDGISIVISTYGRERDLETAFSSILAQTVLPREVIIVDDTPDDSIETVVRQNEGAFSARKIRLYYIRNPRERGIVTARNVGAERAVGDVVLFMDDDVVLDKEYLHEVSKVYETHPWAKGVQGSPLGSLFQAGNPGLLNAFKRAFFLTSISRDRCAMLRSFKSTFPASVSELSECDWLSGCNQSFRRSVLKEFHRDEKLRRYSAGEDADLSFRVHKAFPNALYITPTARFVHNFSQTARPANAEMMFSDFVYSYYLFHKNMGGSTANQLVFAWSWIGRIANWLRDWLGARLKRAGGRDASLKLGDIVAAQALCLNHRDEIRNGDLRFFDAFLQSRASR